MVYQNKFVAAVKINGKVLRENNGEVRVPYGSEYTVLLKNLNSVKAQAKIDIDGSEAVPWVILEPYGSLEIERYLKGNPNSGNRFKFIERTQEIEDHRGVGAEDSLIRVEYKFAKKIEYPPLPLCKPLYFSGNFQSGYWHSDWQSGGVHVNNTTPTRSRGGIRGQSANSVSHWDSNSSGLTDIYKHSQEQERSSNWVTQDFNDQGITVPGSESNQKFYTVPDFETEASEVIVIKLRGQPAGSKPVTVNFKPRCITCGRRNYHPAKFCSNCGTSLVIL